LQSVVGKKPWLLLSLFTIGKWVSVFEIGTVEDDDVFLLEDLFIFKRSVWFVIVVNAGRDEGNLSSLGHRKSDGILYKK